MRLVMHSLNDGEIIVYTLLFRAQYLPLSLSSAEGALILTDQRLLVLRGGAFGLVENIHLAEPAAEWARGLVAIDLDHVGEVALEQAPGHARHWRVAVSYLLTGGQMPLPLVIDFGANRFLAGRFCQRLRREVANTFDQPRSQHPPAGITGQLERLIDLHRMGASTGLEPLAAKGRLL